MKRREAREHTFKLIFQYKFQPDDISVLTDDCIASENAGNEGKYIKETVCGTVENIEEIDAMIRKYTSEKQTDKISAVSLAVLRLGTYEIIYNDDIPDAVAVNEAVALAKEFDGDEAAPFVNGVLDSIKKSKRESLCL